MPIRAAASNILAGPAKNREIGVVVPPDEESSGEQTTVVTPAPEPEPAPATRAISRKRLIGVDALIGVTTVLLIVGMFAIWANRLLFNPDNWSNTSTQLIANPEIRSATSNYLVDQLYANVDVAGLLKQGLPPALQGLAGPAAGALRSGAVQATDLALQRPRVQDLWAQANRAADQTFINVVNGGKGAASTNNGAVTLDLGAILENVASRLGLPSGLSQHLPANVANLTVFKAHQLKTVQNGGKAIKGLALWLTILCPLLYALSILLATGHRRRTLMTVGFAGIFAGVVVFFGRNILQTQVTNSITNDESLRPAIRATIGIGTQLLTEVAGAVVFVGVILVICAWFAGPGRLPRMSREAIAPFLRENPWGAFAVTLGLLALLFIWNPIPATGTPAGIITFTLLALLGTELLIRQTNREFPEARAGAATHAIRTRAASMRRSASPRSSETTADQLKQLAELRDHGALTAEEYETAKTQLLNGG
jgi:putative oligomerization/nucleic acid binding protein